MKSRVDLLLLDLYPRRDGFFGDVGNDSAGREYVHAGFCVRASDCSDVEVGVSAFAFVEVAKFLPAGQDGVEGVAGAG